MDDIEFYCMLVIIAVLVFIAVWVTSAPPVNKLEPWPWPTKKTHGKK